MITRKSVVLIVTLILAVPLLGFSLSQLAVLEAILAAGIDPAAAPLITSKIEEEFVNSGKYSVLDRANIEQVLVEKEFQLSSGIVRNEEVRQAGEYLGADFVVVVNVSRVGQTFVVAAKMIDVVSGQIAAQTSYERQGRIDVLLDIAKVVGERLAGTDVVMMEEEEPEVEEPAEEEVAEAPKVEPVVRPPREREPVEFKRFVVGAKAGGNLSNILWDDFYIWGDSPDNSVLGNEPKSVFGLNAGAYFAYYFSKYIAVQIETNFSQKGYLIDHYDWTFDFYPFGGFVTTTWKFNYLELPVLLKVGFPRNVSVYAVAGVSLAMFLSGTVENVYDDSLAQIDFEFFYNNPEDFESLMSSSGISVNSFDTGLVVGAGVDLLLRSFVVNLEIRYTFGLIDVTDENLFSNSAISFTGGFGYRF
ncbi:MAG: PorT family protein [Spirochaetaceae bacterium]|nr:MAG: PorT family protein [Spirochaetaceae bacterium]